MRISTLASTFVVSALTIACSSSSSGTSGTGSTPQSGPAKACVDTADAVAKAAVRCSNGSQAAYQPNYDQFIKDAANGDCNNIVSVRDENALRNTCIPSFATVPCADLQAGNIDGSCKAQLVRKASFEPKLYAEE
jgi:hypothetical protein